jgi:DHA2 family multidrug resistance protein
MTATARPRDRADDAAASPPESVRPPQAGFTPVPHRGLITVSIMAATVMQALDSTIANVALPHMQGSLAATSDTITWVLTSYIIAAAIMTPTAGWLTGRFGRKRVFLISVAGFTIASMLCGVASTLTEIVLYRLLQGVFGAALVPLSQSVLLDINPREKHGSAMAIWGAGIMVGPILGPMLGGWLTETYNWRWVFFINMPIGIAAFFGIWTFVRETGRDRDRPFDIFGFAMLSLGVGSLQMMLDRGELKDWFSSTEIIIEFGLAIAGLWMFLMHSLTSERPFIRPALFKDRNFVAGLGFIFMVGVIMLATLALLPPMLQDLMEYPVVTTGMVVAPRGFGTMIVMIIAGRLVNRIDGRIFMAAGLCLTSFSLWQMTSYSLLMGESTVIWSGLVQGVGLGLIFVPLSALTFSTLPPEFRTEAAGIFSLMRNVGGSIGISAVETFLTRNVQVNHADLAERITPFNRALHFPILDKYWNLHSAAGLASLDHEITRQASMLAYIDDFKLMEFVTLVALPLVILLRKPKLTAHAAEPAGALE